MPGDNGFGSDNYQRSLPIRPDTGEGDPKYAVSVLKARGLSISLKHIKLMTKGEVLQGERALGLEAGEHGADEN